MSQTATEANAPASQRQQLTEVVGIPGYMATRTGGERTSDPQEVYDGGSIDPETLSAPATTGNIVVGKPYRPNVHAAILKSWDRQAGRLRTTLKIVDTDPDLGPLPQTLRTYPNSLLVRVTWPEGDAGSSEPGRFELEFKPGPMA